MILSPLSRSWSPLSPSTPSSSSWRSSTRTTCRRPRPACPQYSDPYLLAFEPTEDPHRDPWQIRSMQNWPRFGPNSNIEPPQKVSGQSYLLVSMPTGDPLHVAILRPFTVFVTEIPKSFIVLYPPSLTININVTNSLCWTLRDYQKYCSSLYSSLHVVPPRRPKFPLNTNHHFVIDLINICCISKTFNATFSVQCMAWTLPQ